MNQFPIIKMNNKSEFEITKDVVRECMYKMIDNKFFMPRSYVRKLDTIDMTRFAKGNDDGNPAALPQMARTSEEEAMLKENWCLAIPPLLYGSVVMNTARYIVFEVSNIDLEDKSYEVALIDYGYDQNVWQVNITINAKIRYDGRLEAFRQGVDLCDILKSAFIDNSFGIVMPLDPYIRKQLTEIALPILGKAKGETDKFIDETINHFLTAIVRVNCELASGVKPKAVRNKTKNIKVTTVNDKEPERNPKPQIVRTLKSGVTIKSEKVPKAPTIDVVRHYKVASWSVRGHTRYLKKSGKTIYIAPGVHHRKEFEKTDAPKRQTIIISGRRKDNG